jgi:hypothetical protein
MSCHKVLSLGTETSSFAAAENNTAQVNQTQRLELSSQPIHLLVLSTLRSSFRMPFPFTSFDSFVCVLLATLVWSLLSKANATLTLDM